MVTTLSSPGSRIDCRCNSLHGSHDVRVRRLKQLHKPCPRKLFCGCVLVEATAIAGKPALVNATSRGVFRPDAQNATVQLLNKPAPASDDEAPNKSKPLSIFNDEDPTAIDVYNSLSVEGKASLRQLKSFNSLRFTSSVLANNLRLQNIQKPSIVQQYAIPAMQAGKNMVVCSPPGTGKTIAFLLPVLQRLMKTTRPRTNNFAYPLALIICTSWEHCMQIHEACKQLAKGSHLKVTALHGGIPIVDQALKLRGGCDVVVATAGRLLDHIDRGRVRLANLQVLVLDNAELLLNAGSQMDLRRILHSRAMPPVTERQTLAFSSNLSPEHRLLLKELMNNPIFVQVGAPLAAPPHLSQRLLQLDQGQKFEQLLQDLKSSQGLHMVFCSTRSRVEDVYSFLVNRGVKCCSIHREHTQIERENSWQSFKYRVCPVLVTTSISARGLDIPDVDLVINFDLPGDPGEYLCRIGRTGRGGRPGRSISYFAGKDARLAPWLVEMLTTSGQPVPQWLERQATARRAGASAAGGARAGAGGRGMHRGQGPPAGSAGRAFHRVGRNPPKLGGYLDVQPLLVGESGLGCSPGLDAAGDGAGASSSGVHSRQGQTGGPTPAGSLGGISPDEGESRWWSERTRSESSDAGPSVGVALAGSTLEGELGAQWSGVRENPSRLSRESIRGWQQLARMGAVGWPKGRRPAHVRRRQRMAAETQGAVPCKAPLEYAGQAQHAHHALHAEEERYAGHTPHADHAQRAGDAQYAGHKQHAQQPSSIGGELLSLKQVEFGRGVESTEQVDTALAR